MKVIKGLLHKPIYLVLILILIVYLPLGISKPPESIDRQYVASIGIDKIDDGVEVSLLSHVSNQAEKYTRSYILTSAKGPNIPSTLYEISSITGRRVALTHTSTIIVSNEIAENGMHNYLDYFYRDNNVANDTQVVCVQGSAKELLNFEKERVNSSGYSLEEVLTYNSKNIFFTDDNLESFYKGVFGPTKTSTTPIASLIDNPDGEQLLTGGGGGESGGESGGENKEPKIKEKRILSINQLGIYKAGKLKDILSPEEVFGFNLVNSHTKNIYFSIDNFSDEHFENANILFNIEKNVASYNASFENGKPVLTIGVILSLSIDSVLSTEPTKEYYVNDVDFLTDALKIRIEQKIKEKFSLFLQKIFKTNADIFGVYKTFSNQTGKEFDKWLENLDDVNNFLTEIEYRMNVASLLVN